MPWEDLLMRRQTCEILERNNIEALSLGFTRRPAVNLLPDGEPRNHSASVFSDKILRLSLGLELH